MAKNKFRQFFKIKSQKKVFPANINITYVSERPKEEIYVLYVSRRERYPSEKSYELKFRKKTEIKRPN